MIGLGVIGLGIMGERLLRAAREHAGESVRITGVWDPSPAAVARVTAALPGLAVADSAAALIAGAECIYVAAPPAAHLDHGRAVLAAGRALFCEKPLSVDVAAAKAFVAGAAGARAAVNFPFASSPGVARLREWIAAGDIGTPQSLAIEVGFAAWPRSWQRDAVGWLDGRAQGGFTREVVSHFLFLTRRVLGDLAVQTGAAAFPEAVRSERAISARLTAGGLPVTLMGKVGATDRDDENSWTLTGSAGAVRLRDWSVAERRVADRWEPDPEAMANERLRPLVLQRQLASVAAMTRGEAHHLATLAEALAVQQAVERILRGD
jgi:predicted dehydrogenase